MHFSHKNATVTVNIAQVDGILDTYSGEIPYKAGQLILADIYGNTTIETETRFRDNYIPVEVKEDMSDFAKMFENAYGEYNGTELNQIEEEKYITGTEELLKNKAL